MKLTCMAQIYNELETNNLPRFMDSIKRYCNSLVIYNDGCTDGSIDWINNNYHFDYTLDEIHFIHGERNDFRNEIAHKKLMLQKCIDIDSDWIFFIDFDEVIEKRGEDGGIRGLCESDKCDAYGFGEVNLWRSESFYRLDAGFNDGKFCRLWKNTGKLFYDVRPGLHQKQYPDGVDEIITSDIRVVHYGFSSDNQIIRKYKLYKSHGQSGFALDRLIDERTLRVSKSNQDWFRNVLIEENFNDVYSAPVASKI